MADRWLLVALPDRGLGGTAAGKEREQGKVTPRSRSYEWGFSHVGAWGESSKQAGWDGPLRFFIGGGSSSCGELATFNEMAL